MEQQPALTPPSAAQSEQRLAELTEENRRLAAELEELRRRSAALELSEARYRRLVEFNPDGIVLHRGGQIRYANRAALALVGARGEEELIGRGILDLAHPDFRPLIVARAAAMRRGQPEVPLVVERYQRLDGTELWAEVAAMPLPGEPDQDPAILVVLRDISERRRAEQALAAERERLSVTLRSIGDAVIATDAAGLVVLSNPVAEQLTGWSQDQARGRPLDEVFRIINEETRERCISPVEHVLASGQVVGLANHTLLIARDGTERAIADSGAPIRDDAGAVLGVVLVFRDQTEQRRIEQELRHSQTLESLGLLAGGIAHDFNNILTAVFGNLSLGRHLLQRQTGDGMQRLADAEKAIERARQLTQQLLTFARGGAPVLAACALDELLRQSVAFALSGSRVRANLEIPSDLWPVQGDEGQIGQVLHNLTVNAVEAMPAGGVITVRAENVEPRASSDGGQPESGRQVRFSFHNEGTGIRPEHLGRIFEPYFSTKQRGSGLGLSICYSVVRGHGGTLTVESAPGQGTTFTVVLPAASKEPARKVAPSILLPLLTRGRILVMDDDEAVRSTARGMLELLGQQVALARDGEEAVEIYRLAMEQGRRFDAVILDLTVPGGMGGLEAVQCLLALDPQVRALVSSGYADDPTLAEHRQAGFAAALGKPYKFEELVRTLQGVIGTAG